MASLNGSNKGLRALGAGVTWNVQAGHDQKLVVGFGSTNHVPGHRHLETGIVTMCIGGGQALAALFRRAA